MRFFVKTLKIGRLRCLRHLHTCKSRKRRKYFEVSCSLDNIATSSLRALAILHLRCLRNTSNTSIILKLRGLRDLRGFRVFYANHANVANTKLQLLKL